MIEAQRENLSVNKMIAQKKDIIFVEGDMIVPDSKPDILNTICTSGVVCIYKKEVLDDKISIDGGINTCIMYLADDSKDKVRGINTNLDFSETIQVTNTKEGMNCRIENKLKSIECKVINGRKVGIKATIEIDIKIYSNEEIQVINNIENADGIQMLKEDLKVNSLIGMGETKIYAKDTITIDNVDNLAEILKSSVCICDKDIKISYNKILTKAEAEVKIMYLTEDNRINSVKAKVPIVGFIDIPNVTENNICDVNYEIRNMIIKPNAVEEHSIYIEMEIGVIADVYEEKQFNLIQDLYSPCENLEFNKKNVTTITGKRNIKDMKQIREKIEVDNLSNRNIIDVDVIPTIQREIKDNSRITVEGEIELRFILIGDELDVDTKTVRIPFEHTINDVEDSENVNTNMDIEVANQDFIVQDGGNVTSNIDMIMNTNYHRNTNLNIMDEIQTNGEREEQDYNIIMYIVKNNDTLWSIAKRYGSTVDDIVRVNGIEDENKIYVGQKIFIPRYVRSGVSSQNTPMISYA